jgi:hypothetical protein
MYPETQRVEVSCCLNMTELVEDNLEAVDALLHELFLQKALMGYEDRALDITCQSHRTS